MADITKSIAGCDDECGERGEQGGRGQRGHRGHDGPTGPTGSSGGGGSGSTGPTGAPGPTGPAGSSSTDLTITIPNTAATDLLSPVAFHQTLGTQAILAPGDPTTVDPAAANAFIVGLVIASPLIGTGNVTYQFAGEAAFANSDINNITGSPNFVPGDTYYLGGGDSLTNVRPTTVGQYIVSVGQAIDRTHLNIEIGTPILIGATTTIAAATVALAGTTFINNTSFASVSSLGVGHYRLITSDPTFPDADTLAAVTLNSPLGGQISYVFGLGGAGTVDVFTFNTAGVAQNSAFSIELLEL